MFGIVSLAMALGYFSTRPDSPPTLINAGKWMNEWMKEPVEFVVLWIMSLYFCKLRDKYTNLTENEWMKESVEFEVLCPLILPN